MNDNRHSMPRKEGTAMRPCSSATPTQTLEAASPTNHFQRRLAICLVLTAFNVLVVATCAGTLYRATAYDTIEQVGVTLLFATLLGSLARVWFLTLKSRAR
jgi:hypothetical protein